jgi:hypothetical protein
VVGAPHPFFVPKILNAGVSEFTTGEVAEQLVIGFLRAAWIQKLLGNASAADNSSLTYLAGIKNVVNTREGIERPIAGAEK